MDFDVHADDYRLKTDIYSTTVTLFNKAQKPLQYERRFAYMRDNVWTMDSTRKAFWQFALAGGASSIWGYFPATSSHDWSNGGTYSHLEQLHTHLLFWRYRFLPDFERRTPANGVFIINTPDNKHRVLYKENTNSMAVDLSSMSGSRKAIAVNTKSAYSEVDLGTLSPSNQTITLPTKSDWAIAIGDFLGAVVLDTVTPVSPPTAPANLAVSSVSSSRTSLSWTDNADNESGFRIERKLGSTGSWSEIGTVSAQPRLIKR